MLALQGGCWRGGDGVLWRVGMAGGALLGALGALLLTTCVGRVPTDRPLPY